jgi:hypothetical protein
VDAQRLLQDVQLLRGFVAAARAGVVEPVVAVAEAAELEELETGRGIVFAYRSGKARPGFTGWAFVAASRRDL